MIAFFISLAVAVVAAEMAQVYFFVKNKGQNK